VQEPLIAEVIMESLEARPAHRFRLRPGDVEDTLEQLGGVARIDSAAGHAVGDDFTAGVVRAGQNRLARPHRLEVDEPEAFASGRKAKATAGAQTGIPNRIIHATQEFDVDGKMAGERLETWAIVSISHYHQAKFGTLPLHGGPDANHFLVAFVSFTLRHSAD
jgi:hypothetical protein